MHFKCSHHTGRALPFQCKDNYKYVYSSYQLRNLPCVRCVYGCRESSSVRWGAKALGVSACSKGEASVGVKVLSLKFLRQDGQEKAGGYTRRPLIVPILQPTVVLSHCVKVVASVLSHSQIRRVAYGGIIVQCPDITHRAKAVAPMFAHVKTWVRTSEHSLVQQKYTIFTARQRGREELACSLQKRSFFGGGTLSLPTWLAC